MQINDTKALELAFHQGPTFINAYCQLYILELFPSQIVHDDAFNDPHARNERRKVAIIITDDPIALDERSSVFLKAVKEVSAITLCETCKMIVEVLF